MPEDATTDIQRTLDTIIQELQQRVDFEGLSESDQLAILTAIQKAGMRGFMQGVAIHSFASRGRLEQVFDEVRALLRPGLVLPEHLTETYVVGPEGDVEVHDPWLDRYGADPE